MVFYHDRFGGWHPNFGLHRDCYEMYQYIAYWFPKRFLGVEHLSMQLTCPERVDNSGFHSRDWEDSLRNGHLSMA